MTIDNTGIAPPVAAAIGMGLAYFDILPDDVLIKTATLLLTGAVTGAAGLVSQRLLRNVLHRVEKRHMLPSILMEKDDDDTNTSL